MRINRFHGGGSMLGLIAPIEYLQQRVLHILYWGVLRRWDLYPCILLQPGLFSRILRRPNLCPRIMDGPDVSALMHELE